MGRKAIKTNRTPRRTSEKASAKPAFRMYVWHPAHVSDYTVGAVVVLATSWRQAVEIGAGEMADAMAAQGGPEWTARFVAATRELLSVSPTVYRSPGAVMFYGGG